MGCYIGYNFVDELAYADNNVVLAPAVSPTRHMLKTRDSVAIEYNTESNAAKSECIAFYRILVCSEIRLLRIIFSILSDSQLILF
jgi:hypothetical protein